MVLCYDGLENLYSGLSSVCQQHGAFDMVLDTVSSHDERDQQCQYERRISQHRAQLLKSGSMYLIIGGTSYDWLLAHLKRFLGVNLFKPGRLLHWIRFPGSTHYLQKLAQLCDDRQLKIRIQQQFPVTSENVQKAFGMQMDRRVAGKIILLWD